MLVLITIGLLAGLVTSLSPCVLPVLPVVLAGAAPPFSAGGPAHRRPARSWRPVAVVAGLVASFCLSTLLGSLVLDALGLPQDLLRDLGIAVLVLVGLGMVVVPIGELLERPFSRLPGRPVDPARSGFVVGLGAGLLFVPCAGPVLATIAVVGATDRVGPAAVVLTASFGVGVGVPLLALAVAGDAVVRRTRALRQRAPALRRTGGVVMIVIAVALGLNLTDGLQQLVPGYTTALQAGVENDRAAAGQLQGLVAEPPAPVPAPTVAPQASPVAADVPCVARAAELADCGPAPALQGIDAWLNTPGGRPLDLAGLRGKVVLVDFWTYSCINCQRTLPYREAWYQAYERSGLVVIGVHTPEFAFEHVTANVAAQAAALGVHYPVAIDNHFATWNAYHNTAWPSTYLVDATGTIRHFDVGEGDYDGTERLIRTLLATARPGVALPPPTDVAGTATPGFLRTPETYLGYRYRQQISGTVPSRDRARSYAFPPVLRPDTFALAGTWQAGAQAVTAAGEDARIELSYQADTVNLVLGGTGTVTVDADGAVTTVAVSGPPTLYLLHRGSDDRRTTVTVSVSKGVQAYAFTFG